MKRKAALLFPLMLMFSVNAYAEANSDARHLTTSAVLQALHENERAKLRGMARDRAELNASYRVPSADQVRIEQRVIVRVAPHGSVPRQNLMADLPQRPAPPQFIERPMNTCIAVANIAGVQTSEGNRLLLYLRDRRLVSASLERACRARDFYSGFYLEKNKDGRLCVNRDKLQSRSGTKCEVERMKQLIAVTE